MSITVESISNAIGARVTDIDLREEMSEETVKAVHQAWMDYQVLVFPGQDLSEEDQVRFTAHFGEIGGRNRKVPTAEGDRVKHRGVMLVSNIREDGKPIGSLPDGEMMFHSDGAYARRPFRYTLLYAIEVPSVGGNTKFANMYKAYDALPDELKAKLANCQAEHVYYAGSVQKDAPSKSLTGARLRPVFIKHEETGRTALYVSRLLTTRIEGMDEAESDAILEQLFDISERDDFVYEHKWTPGDFVMWDNRCSNHARTDFSEGERRLLRRTTVFGTDLIPAFAAAA
ncbi:MAG: taurine catabolism dioxygenase TauD [Rhodospirillaceae bacterium]|nr:taurine catabolism dioxygenase TauD [Rhodospirillaceae bacterium]|tara:strand:+ start:29109 stop:29966 length:858 start_codon:yes stop_codon:yes gene_type:complete